MSDAFDRALRAAARRGRIAGVCPDATAMAAYVDGRLAPNERRELEAHAADCPSCLRHLALLGSVSLDTPEPGVWWLQWLPHWRWLVPVVSAVLVVAVWVGLPDEARRTLPAPRQDAADVADSPASAPREADSRTPTVPLTMPAPDVQSSPVAERADPPSKATAFLQEGRRRAAPQPGATPDGTAPAGAAISVEPLTESVTVTEPPAAPAAAAAPTQAPAPPPALADTDPVEGVLGGSRVAADSAANRSEAQLEKAGSEARLLVDDEQGTRFRVVGGRIERSSDRGESWHAVFADARVTFTAAACAPDASCWFGGTGGTMVRVRAGEATRTVLPGRARVDVIVVTPDHVEATVDTGARFRTTDGGHTWTLGRRP